MQRLRLFSICSNSSQRNSIFILYNKGAVREEQKNILPRCHAGNENRASPAETGRRGPLKKHCPLLMRGNSQGGGQTTNHLLTAANVWEFSYTASAAFSSFPRRWLFLFVCGLNLSVSLRSPASGLRLPASASCKVLHSRPAGRCPNNSSLFPPLAAVVVVALVGEPLAKDSFFDLFAFGSQINFCRKAKHCVSRANRSEALTLENATECQGLPY